MEEKMDTFNIPQYTPSLSEVKLEVLREWSFTIDRLEVTKIHWNAYNDRNDINFTNSFPELCIDGAYNVTKCMRAMAEPLLASHFGEAIIEEVFGRYQEILVDRMSKEKTEFINVSISMTKKV
jgi:jasmonate O-methyltransferase